MSRNAITTNAPNDKSETNDPSQQDGLESDQRRFVQREVVCDNSHIENAFRPLDSLEHSHKGSGLLATRALSNSHIEKGSNSITIDTNATNEGYTNDFPHYKCQVIDVYTRELPGHPEVIDTGGRELTAQDHDASLALVDDKRICSKPGAYPIQRLNGLQSDVAIARAPMNYVVEADQALDDSIHEVNHFRNEGSTYLVAENDVHVVPSHNEPSNPTAETNITGLLNQRSQQDAHVVSIHAVPYQSTKETDQNRKLNRFDQKKKLRRIIFIFGVLIPILAGIIATGICFGSSKCNGTNKTNEAIASVSKASTANNEANDVSNHPYVKPFYAQNELFHAVDKFLNGTFTLDDIALYGEIQFWDVSRIQNFSRLFSVKRTNLGSEYFEEDLSRWDISAAIDTSGMFDGAFSFNANLSLWNVGQVTDMSMMFRKASEFEGHGVDRWNTSSVTTMRSMFSLDIAFDANLSKWDVSKVTNFSQMFECAYSFNGNGLNHWNTSSAKNMKYMFANEIDYETYFLEYEVPINDDEYDYYYGQFEMLFNADLSTWDVSNVYDMSYMFHGAKNFQGTFVEYWNTSNVRTISGMFSSLSSFNANLSRWEVGNVEEMDFAFSSIDNFQGIGIDTWNTSKVSNMAGMFSYTHSFNADLSNWDVGNVQSMNSMFTSSNMFQGRGLEYWNTSNLRSMRSMFRRASVFEANLSRWDTSRVKNMKYTFAETQSFSGIGLDRWNVSEVSNAQFMFFNATSFNANLSKWNVSDLDMRYMFEMFDEAISFPGVSWYDERAIHDTLHVGFTQYYVPSKQTLMCNETGDEVIEMYCQFPRECFATNADVEEYCSVMDEMRDCLESIEACELLYFKDYISWTIVDGDYIYRNTILEDDHESCPRVYSDFRVTNFTSLKFPYDCQVICNLECSCPNCTNITTV
jgi:surface protein